MHAYSHTDATLADLPTIVEIYNSTIASRMVTADTEPVTLESRLPWFHEHSPQRRPLWVARADEDAAGAAAVPRPPIIGWMSYSNFYGRPAYSGTAELSIYLHEDWRGKGLGRYFLTQAIARAPALEVHTLLGFIFGHNEASLKLFHNFGFERWAALPRVARLDDVERDLIILGKRVA